MSIEYFQRRQHILIDKLAKENLDGMIVTNLTHIRYLCGFTGSSATLLITADQVHFITDGRYVVQSEKEVKGAKAKYHSAQGYIRQMRHYLKHGDWCTDFYGPYEEKRIKWVTITPKG